MPSSTPKSKAEKPKVKTPKKFCTYPNCERWIKRSGFCGKHLQFVENLKHDHRLIEMSQVDNDVDLVVFSMLGCREEIVSVSSDEYHHDDAIPEIEALGAVHLRRFQQRQAEENGVLLSEDDDNDDEEAGNDEEDDNDAMSEDRLSEHNDVVDDNDDPMDDENNNNDDKEEEEKLDEQSISAKIETPQKTAAAKPATTKNQKRTKTPPHKHTRLAVSLDAERFTSATNMDSNTPTTPSKSKKKRHRASFDEDEKVTTKKLAKTKSHRDSEASQAAEESQSQLEHHHHQQQQQHGKDQKQPPQSNAESPNQDDVDEDQDAAAQAPPATATAANGPPYSWESLGLGSRNGTVAYNAYLRNHLWDNMSTLNHVPQYTTTEMLQFVRSLRPRTILPRTGTDLFRKISEGETMEGPTPFNSSIEWALDDGAGNIDTLSLTEHMYRNMLNQDCDDWQFATESANKMTATECIETMQSFESEMSQLKRKEERILRTSRSLGLLDTTARKKIAELLLPHRHSKMF